MITMKSLRHSALALLLVAAFITVGVYEAAAELELLATVGRGGCDSLLVEIDPATAEIIREIGRVGFTVNGMAWDWNDTGKLYASTSRDDPSYNGLIEIDPATGEGTAIGVNGWGFGSDRPVTNITVNSSGQMYGWVEWVNSTIREDLVIIDKYTGIATWVGDSGLSTNRHGLAFDNTDTLYLYRSGGDYYIINTSTGAATYQGDLNVTGHHGVFHPISNEYYGLDSTRRTPRLLRARLSLPSPTVLSRRQICCDCVHTLAFFEEDACILDLDLDYNHGSNQLEMEFTVRERAPSVLAIWLNVFHQSYYLGGVGLPPVVPRQTFDVDLSFPNVGNIGILATLSTEGAGIACSDWETTDTGW